MTLSEAVVPALLAVANAAAIVLASGATDPPPPGTVTLPALAEPPKPRPPRPAQAVYLELPNGDPFREITEARVEAVIQRRVDTFVFRGTFGSGSGRKAIINDRFVAVGGSIGDAVVKAIEENRCVVVRNGEDVVLTRQQEQPK